MSYGASFFVGKKTLDNKIASVYDATVGGLTHVSISAPKKVGWTMEHSEPNHYAKHPHTTWVVSELVRLRAAYWRKRLLPAIPPAIFIALMALRVVPVPHRFFTIAVVIVGSIVYAIWWRGILRSAAADQEWVKIWKGHLKRLVLPRIEESQQQNEKAAAILDNVITSNSDFVLFLRNFDIEGSITVKGDQVWSVMSGENKFENALADAIGSRFHVLAATNPAALMAGVSRFPELELGEQWREELTPLIGSSYLIVLYLEQYSDGVLEELRIIREHQAQTRTVVVICSPDPCRDVMKQLLAEQQPPSSPPTAADPQLADLPYVIQEEDLDFEHIYDRPPFGAFLQSMTFRSGLDASKRRQLKEATKRYGSLAEQETSDSLLAEFVEGATVFESLGDRLFWMRMQYNIGKCHHDKGRLSEAVVAYEKVLNTARELQDELMIAVVQYQLGRALWALDEKDRAYSFLLDALPLLEKLKQKIEHRNTLVLLGHIYQAREEFWDALSAYHSALKFFTSESTFSANMCSLICSIGDTYLSAGMYQEAIDTFQSGGYASIQAGYDGLAEYAAKQIEKARDLMKVHGSQNTISDGEDTSLGDCTP
jgi:tetratricopeptide (TPR) repeat protein